MAGTITGTTPPAPDAVGIWDAITTFTSKVQNRSKNSALLSHNGDSITIGLPEGWIGCTVRLTVTESVTEGGKTIDSIKHEPHVYAIGYGSGNEQTKTITLTGEFQEGSGLPFTPSYFHDINYYVSLDLVRVRFTNADGLVDEANIVPSPPPPPPKTGGNDGATDEFPWWIVGVAVAVAVAIVVVWYFYRRRVSIPGPAAPAAPVAAPSSVVVVK